MVISSSSPRVTQALAEALARELTSRSLGLPHATILALEGPLGAGKTTFVQGFTRALGVKRNLPSPTFVLIRRYPLRGKRYRNLFHVDAYRLTRNAARDLSPLELTKEMGNPRNLILIEWADRIRTALPRGTIRISFRHHFAKNASHDTLRTISFTAPR
jgi:tRNA threonylcarbamoyladenosine biosynthesis protein TsaE